MNAITNNAIDTTNANDYQGDYLVQFVGDVVVYTELDELVLDLGGTYF